MPFTSVSVSNGSFQGQALGANAWTTNPPGWVASGTAGDWNPPNNTLPGATGNDQVGFANSGGSLSQDLSGVVVSETGIVQVTMELHGRSGSANYEMTLTVNGTTIPAVAITGSGPGAGAMSNPTFTFNMADIPGVASLVGQQVGFSIKNTGGPQLNFDDITAQHDPGAPVCFCRGTLIQTKDGAVPVEDLREGDMIKTVKRGYQPLRWVGKTVFSGQLLEKQENLRPIRIEKDAIGQGIPKRDLFVSRQHRLQVSSKISMRMFGVPDVLATAKNLTSIPGISVAENYGRVEYYHILLDHHEVVFAEGALAESLFLGPQTFRTLPDSFRNSLKDLNILAEPVNVSAYNVPPAKKQRELAMRHAKNAKNLCLSAV